MIMRKSMIYNCSHNLTAELVIAELPDNVSSDTLINEALKTKINGAWCLEIDGKIIGNTFGSALYDYPRVIRTLL